MTTPHNPPLPQPPFYSVPNINNLRDAALYPLGTPNGQIRPGILFRSAEVSRLDRSGWKAIRDIGVGHVFDLRSTPEVIKGWGGVTGQSDSKDVRPGWIEDMEAEGIKRSWVPVFEESDYSPERLAERYLKYMGESVDGFVQAYQDILLHASESYRTILLYLANLPPADQEAKEPLGALIHCTAGKDRTGIFFGLLFSFLGVPREIIAEEYNLTELGLAHVRGEISSRLMLSPGFKKYTLSQMAGRDVTPSELAEVLKNKDVPDAQRNGEEPEPSIPPEIIEKGKRAALRMTGAKKESMLGALDMIDKEWGSAEAYMRKVCGLGDKELEALRRNLVIPA